MPDLGWTEHIRNHEDAEWLKLLVRMRDDLAEFESEAYAPLAEKACDLKDEIETILDNAQVEYERN